MPLDLANNFHASIEVYGRNGEISEMLALKDRGDGGPPRSMTLLEAIKYHLKVWGFTPSEDDPAHEAAHLIFALSCLLRRNKLGTYEYQSNKASEVFAEPITSQINQVVNTHVIVGKGYFTEVLNEEYSKSYQIENLARVVIHEVGKITGLSYDQIKGAQGIFWTDTYTLCSNYGIGIKYDQGRGIVHLSPPNSPDVYSVAYAPNSAERYPQESSFKRFEKPDDDEIISCYESVKPALKLIRNKLVKSGMTLPKNIEERTKKAEAVFAQITMRKLYDTMKRPLNTAPVFQYAPRAR